ncbi:hypothetical protein [Campylobacter curvus]|uniref:hypothetical protein n=1 Tax=Campylobacter curvus TaxID=200 RepID=UPI00147051D9|nr:hypothetical protein [Campylobacter curvus]
MRIKSINGELTPVADNTDIEVADLIESIARFEAIKHPIFTTPKPHVALDNGHYLPCKLETTKDETRIYIQVDEVSLSLLLRRLVLAAK